MSLTEFGKGFLSFAVLGRNYSVPAAVENMEWYAYECDEAGVSEMALEVTRNEKRGCDNAVCEKDARLPFMAG